MPPACVAKQFDACLGRLPSIAVRSNQKLKPRSSPKVRGGSKIASTGLPNSDPLAPLDACVSLLVRLRAHSEIGRASCRERVCQYVYISVVALSLKKKNK